MLLAVPILMVVKILCDHIKGAGPNRGIHRRVRHFAKGDITINRNLHDVRVAVLHFPLVSASFSNRPAWHIMRYALTHETQIDIVFIGGGDGSRVRGLCERRSRGS